MAQVNPLEEGNLSFPMVYEEPEDMGPSSLHPYSDPFEAAPSGWQSASAPSEGVWSRLQEMSPDSSSALPLNHSFNTL